MQMIIGILLLSTASGSQSLNESPRVYLDKPASICDLSKKSLKKNGVVSVFGRISGGFERIFITDDRCPQRSIEITFANTNLRNPKVKQLWDVIFRQGTIGTVGKEIYCTVTGRLSHQNYVWTKGSILISNVEDLSVKYSLPNNR